MNRLERQAVRRSLHDGRGPVGDPIEDVSIGELLKRISSDASLLVRQELSLARAELRDSAKRVQQMAKSVAIAALLAIPGALALTAFAIIGLGQAINSYWASALIVGVVLVVAAAVVARQGLSRVTDGKVGLRRTAESLEEDARFGKDELRAFKRELTA